MYIYGNAIGSFAPAFPSLIFHPFRLRGTLHRSGVRFWSGMFGSGQDEGPTELSRGADGTRGPVQKFNEQAGEASKRQCS